MPIALAILALVIVSLIIGSLLNFTFLFLAVPLILLLFMGMAGSEAMRRQRRVWQMKRFRRGAKAQKIDFDEDDKKTIVV